VYATWLIRTYIHVYWAYTPPPGDSYQRLLRNTRQAVFYCRFDSLMCVVCDMTRHDSSGQSQKECSPRKHLITRVRGTREHCRFDSLMCMTWLDMTHQVSLKRGVPLEKMLCLEFVDRENTVFHFRFNSLMCVTWLDVTPSWVCDMTLSCVCHACVEMCDS